MMKAKKICENENSQTHTPNRKKRNNGLDVISNDWNKFMLTEEKNFNKKQRVQTHNERWWFTMRINREKNLII